MNNFANDDKVNIVEIWWQRQILWRLLYYSDSVDIHALCYKLLNLVCLYSELNTQVNILFERNLKLTVCFFCLLNKNWKILVQVLLSVDFCSLSTSAKYATSIVKLRAPNPLECAAGEDQYTGASSPHPCPRLERSKLAWEKLFTYTVITLQRVLK